MQADQLPQRTITLEYRGWSLLSLMIPFHLKLGQFQVILLEVPRAVKDGVRKVSSKKMNRG
jgi:hypothetical protein